MQSFKQFLNEIEAIHGSNWKGDSDDISDALQGTNINPTYKSAKELPGGSGLTYGVKKDSSSIDIFIFDNEAKPVLIKTCLRYSFYSEKKNKSSKVPIVGHLNLTKSGRVDNTWQVEMVSVVKSHRGKKIGLSLYGIALDILKLTLLAGSSQTPTGIKMWTILKDIPGVKVYGLFDAEEFDSKDFPSGSGPFVNDRNYMAVPVSVDSKGRLETGSRKLKIYKDGYSYLVAKKTG